MTRKWIKRIILIVLIPVLLIFLLLFLIYIPPIQNYLQREVTAYVSKTSGMQISIDQIHLRFPLHLVAKEVRVIQAPDTILSVESMGLNVKLIPLFKGNIEATGVFLENGTVNTAHLIEGMQLQGAIGRFRLDTRTISLTDKIAALDRAELKDTRLQILLNDTTTTPKDTTKTAVDWKVTLETLKVNNLSIGLEMPADSLKLSGYIDKAGIHEVTVDLGEQLYGLQKLLMSGTSIRYDRGILPPAKGLDPSHIYLRDINIEIDSVRNRGMEIAAIVRNVSMMERSGLSINSMTGKVSVDSTRIYIPGINMQTSYSELSFKAQADWDSADMDIRKLDARLSVRLGRQDVMLFAGNLPEDFQKRYPIHPLVVRVDATGSIDHVRIPRLSAELPGAFSLSGNGAILQVMDSINRSANMELQLNTKQLDFLLALAGIPDDGSVVIPEGIVMSADLGMKGSQYNATLFTREQEGRIQLTADLNGLTEAYKADLAIDSLQVNHFMPKDSIYGLSASASVTGKGFDLRSVHTTASLKAAVNRLEYGKYEITDINLTGDLKNAVATGHFSCINPLAIMDIWGEYRMNSRYTEAKASVNIADIDVYELGLIDSPMRNTLSLALSADIQKDSINVLLYSGDLQARLKARGTLEELIEQSVHYTNVLMKQVEAKQLNHIELRQALPSAAFQLKAGHENPLSRYLALQNIAFGDVSAGFIATPKWGINGRASIHSLKADTLLLDTVYVVAYQDTARLNLRAGVSNGPGNPQYTFKASLTGEVRSEDAEVMFQFKNEDDETGVLLGANMRPAGNGVRVRFIPENPIVAFRQFNFNEHNRVYIRNNGRVLADVEMLDSIGMGVRIHSLPDTTYLQNLDIEIRRINLGDISRVLPYYPSFGGLFSAEATFQQTEKDMQLSAEANIRDLEYENNRVSNIGLGLTWLPGNEGKHYVDGYLTNEGEQVMMLNGSYQTGANEHIDVDANLLHFPLYLANAFIPDRMVEVLGDVDGEIVIGGKPAAPSINGELVLDSVKVIASQYGMNFTLDQRPLKIENGRITFNEYSIYTTGMNPFAIGGYVDFKNLSAPRADLTLNARNYKLLDSPRKEGRLLYGKIFFDMNSTVKGPLNNLVMRGNLNLLGSTKANYVLTDSPLTVQDRLGDLVVFTSFSDTLAVQKEEEVVPISGIDVMLTINVDQSVQLGVDLSADRSSYVDIEGGGNLSFQYTPQGNMVLTGRYTLTDGKMKYSLPVIPLKEFKINEGSYVEWTGNPMDPKLNFKATERMRASVSSDDSKRMVSFDVSIAAKNTLNDLELTFDLEAPENGEVQQQLNAMAPEERSKQAVAMMATGIYLAGGSAGGGNFDMGSALNSVLQSQINNIAGSALKTVNITFGMENYDNAGNTRTDYNFKYSQKLFNDRVQVVVGGSISTGDNTEQTESFIDNVSLEYRLDRTGTRYVRLYHNKNYESVLEGEVIETGVGLVLRKKVNRLGELFIFKKSK